MNGSRLAEEAVAMLDMRAATGIGVATGINVADLQDWVTFLVGLATLVYMVFGCIERWRQIKKREKAHD